MRYWLILVKGGSKQNTKIYLLKSSNLNQAI